MKAVELLKSDKYKSRILKTMKEEIAATDFMAAMDFRASVEDIANAATLVSQLKGETYPSGTKPGGHVIIQRRPYGVV